MLASKWLLFAGVGAVTSIADGLFLLRPNWAKLYEASHGKGPHGAQFRTRKYVTIGPNCPTLEQRRDCVPKAACPKAAA